MSQVNSMSLRARINNFAKKEGISPLFSDSSGVVIKSECRMHMTYPSTI